MSLSALLQSLIVPLLAFDISVNQKETAMLGQQG